MMFKECQLFFYLSCTCSGIYRHSSLSVGVHQRHSFSLQTGQNSPPPSSHLSGTLTTRQAAAKRIRHQHAKLWSCCEFTPPPFITLLHKHKSWGLKKSIARLKKKKWKKERNLSNKLNIKASLNACLFMSILTQQHITDNCCNLTIRGQQFTSRLQHSSDRTGTTCWTTKRENKSSQLLWINK